MIQNIFSEELIQALGWTMIHSLWQGFAVAILMGLAMIVLQKKPAKVRYEIAWFALFLVFVLSLSTFIYLYDSVAGGEVLGTTITIITETGIAVENAEIVQTFFQKTIHYFNTHLPLIVSLWMVGMVFFFLRLLGGIAYVERLKHQKQNQLPEAWQQIFEKLVARFPMKKTVRFAESSLAKVPMVIGYFKPIILFPVGAVNQLSTEEVEAVLAHELAHIYRNDYLLNIIQSIIEIIFYYHPAVWWISANIRTERENCCDDIAVKLCGNSLTYVKALVNLEEMHSAPSLAMSFSSGSKNQLLNRVKRILNQPQNKFNIMEKFTATCFLLGVLFLFSVSATEPVEDEMSNEQKSVTTDFPNEIEDKNTWVNDTIPTSPKTNDNQKFVYSNGKDKVEVEYENDELVKLKINGETIPSDEYADYDEYLEELKTSIPEPPVPPSIGDLPVAPPVRPYIRLGEIATSTIMDFDNSSKKMVIKKDEDGNVIIITDSGKEGEDTYVLVGDGDIKLNGVFIKDEEFPIIWSENEIAKKHPQISFMSEGGIRVHSFDKDKLIVPNLAALPEFLDTFGLDALAALEMPDMSDFPEIEIPDLALVDFDIPEFEMPEMPMSPEMNFNYNFDTIPHGNIWIDGNEMEWDELSDEEREEYQNKLREAHEQLKEAQITMKERMEELKALNTERYKEQMEQAREQMAEARERMKEAQQLQREQMIEMRQEQKERMQELRELQREKNEIMREREMERREERAAKQSKWVSAIETQLRSYGHIKSNGSFKFVLTDDQLKINGKTQSEADWEKYKGVYESNANHQLNGSFKIKISTDRNNNKNISVSTSSDSSH